MLCFVKLTSDGKRGLKMQQCSSFLHLLQFAFVIGSELEYLLEHYQQLIQFHLHKPLCSKICRLLVSKEVCITDTYPDFSGLNNCTTFYTCKKLKPVKYQISFPLLPICGSASVNLFTLNVTILSPFIFMVRLRQVNSVLKVKSQVLHIL